MWLSNSSVGRKFIMAVTGAFLVLFVTFHCLMNAIAIVWPTAYNAVCMFLGANWYALLASAVLAAFIVVHIIYAVILTVQNRKARGSQRYAISHRPKGVEWSSQNMLVLGIVILAFLVVHMIQFWAKMQLAEIMGSEGEIPAVAGTLFLQEAFSQPWTIVVYMIGFVALWFHLTHGFWSMFQSVGWDSTAWIPRLKCIGNVWVSIVVALFIAEGVVFTVSAMEGKYKTDEALRDQYKEMMAPMVAEAVGAPAEAIMPQLAAMPFDMLSQQFRQMQSQAAMQMAQLESPQAQEELKKNPEFKAQVEAEMKKAEALDRVVKLLDYLEEGQAQAQPNPMQMTQM